MVVDRRDHVQYLTVSKSYSDNCTCSLTEQSITLTTLSWIYPLNSLRSQGSFLENAPLYKC